MNVIETVEQLTNERPQYSKQQLVFMREYEALKKQCQSLSVQHEDYKAKNDRLLQEAKKTLKDLKIYFNQEIAILSEENEQLRDSNNQLGHRMQELTADYTKSNEDCIRLRKQMQEMKREHRAEIQRYNTERLDQERLLGEREEEIEGLRNELENLHGRMTQLQSAGEEQRMRSEEDIEKLNGLVGYLKLQAKQYQKQLQTKDQLLVQYNGAGEKTAVKVKELELRVNQAENEIAKMKQREEEICIKMAAQLRESRKKWGDERSTLEKQLQQSHRELTLMGMKVEKYEEMLKKRDQREVMRRNLLEDERLEIDRLQSLLKL